jgi:5'-deoxynucleotidase YfbR-like HD superfamily hydrolase
VKKVEQVLAVRDAGEVERAHCIPHVGSYSNAKHCYGAVSLLLLLHPNPSVELIKAVNFHDTAELWLGDIPSPGKSRMPDVRALYELHERAMLLEVFGEWPDLSEEDDTWLKAVDQVDFFLWARNQYAMGNTRILKSLENVSKSIEGK